MNSVDSVMNETAERASTSMTSEATDAKDHLLATEESAFILILYIKLYLRKILDLQRKS